MTMNAMTTDELTDYDAEDRAALARLTAAGRRAAGWLRGLVGGDRQLAAVADAVERATAEFRPYEAPAADAWENALSAAHGVDGEVRGQMLGHLVDPAGLEPVELAAVDAVAGLVLRAVSAPGFSLDWRLDVQAVAAAVDSVLDRVAVADNGLDSSTA